MVWLRGALCTCRSRWPCSCQHSCRLVCSTLGCLLWSRDPRSSASSNRSLFSIQLLLLCQVCANQWDFFSPFSFNVCPTNKIQCKWASEGGAVVFFGAPWPSEKRLNQTGAKDVCCSAGKGASRTLASRVASANFCAANPVSWSCKGGCVGLRDAFAEWQKIRFFFSRQSCCLLPDTLLLAPARLDLNLAMQE